MIAMDHRTAFQAENAIRQRLRWIRALPDGVIHRQQTERYEIVIHKLQDQLSLVFEDPAGDEVMSRIDLSDPLNLPALYTRAMLLCLLWNRLPRRVHAVGFGGGRVPMLLHHLLPGVAIDATDIEPALADLAAKYFGVVFDERLRLVIADGREYLEQSGASVGYDVILVDVFRGRGGSPFRFCTREFFQACQRCLAAGGQVLVNLFESDPLYLSKIATFRQVFPQVYLYRCQRENVLIGTDSAPLMAGELIQRALEVQQRYSLRFSLVDLVYNILTPGSLDALLAASPSACQTLSDRYPPSSENVLL